MVPIKRLAKRPCAIAPIALIPIRSQDRIIPCRFKKAFIGHPF
jgi:hypothetical protein